MRLGFSDEELKSNSKFLPFEGRFLVRVRGITEKTSLAGNQVLSIDFEGLGAHAGQATFEMITVVQSQKWKVGKFLLGCGFTENELKASVDINDAIGRVLILVRKKNGKKVTKFSKKTGKEETYDDYDTRFERATGEELEQAGGHAGGNDDPAPNFTEDTIPF